MLPVGLAGGSEEEVDRQSKVASRPELSSTEQPLREGEYCTARKVNSQELLGTWLGEGGRSSHVVGAAGG